MASPVSASTTYGADTTRYEWLVNDWDANSNLWINVQGDYTVSLQAQGFYGVQLRHVAEQLSGNLKSIAVVPTAGGAELEQVDELIPPGAGQYRMSPLPTGRIEFSSASNGVQYTIKYISSGNINSETVINDIAEDINAVAGDLAVPGDVNITGQVAVGGIPVYGWLADGTPIYAKSLDVTITTTNLGQSTLHGIANAWSSDRIIDVRARHLDTVTNQIGENRTTDDDLIYHIYWNDLNVWISRNGNGSGTQNYRLLIIYKD